MYQFSIFDHVKFSLSAYVSNANVCIESCNHGKNHGHKTPKTLPSFPYRSNHSFDTSKCSKSAC